MKILILEFRDITHPEAGGAEVVLDEVFRRVAAAGHSVHYLCSRHGTAPAEEVRDGIRYFRRGNQFYFNLAAAWAYHRELRHHHQYDLIFEGVDKVPFFMPVMERRLPVMCLVPHLFGSTAFREVAWPLAAYVWAMERPIPWIYKHCLVSTPSESSRQDLAKRGLPLDNVRVIHNGLDHGLYWAPPVKPERQRPTLLYLGRIKRYKGIEQGFHAILRLRATYPDILYRIVGAGDYVAPLQAMVARLGIGEHVDFMGRVSEARKVELLQQADVLLYLSPKEGWGLSVLEANACGTIAIASDSPGLRDAVRHERTGFLIPHGDADTLARRIDQLLSGRELYGRMRANGIEWAESFTWDRAARETIAIMQEACARFKAPR